MISASSGLFQLRPQIVSIAVVLIILATLFITYYVKLKKIPVNQAPGGIVLIVQIYVEYIRNLVVDILGKRLEKLTPYFVFLFSYLILSNVIGIVGLENPTASLTVTLTLGLVMFIGTFVIGLRFQKLSYLTRFTFNIQVNGKHVPVMINPLGIIEVIAPLISISFRLWGNIFAGSLIATLWFYLTADIFHAIPVIGVINLLGGLTAPPIHGYFDLLCGCIQALVFTLLTMVYWTLAKSHGNYDENGQPLHHAKKSVNTLA
ncbi:MAG: F0F1 ATP synthase subunit A [Mycoplasmataceae bacterium]|nr:F0F1 ATP synthase subunit A [Mycoplasmataceae bacterium]